MSKHTPGPWGCTYTSNHAHDYRLTKAGGHRLPVNAEGNDHSEQRANARLIARAPEMAAEIERLTAENEKLRAALCPLAGVFLYPDDLGFEASSDIKEDLDWDDDANDMNTENVFVLRRDIRRARAALEEK